ncbi:Crp/Fnr family transcriptional regulator [Hymenobacter arizonensis]|uniref:cAMP-binding domain of CRP or a regulatory subunit of cAMP-dependent protein kinases n=1 Tax=Hymenobacter arizonensis TaxID=1227077 RepID=A0A1I5X982_HYMAR|nr:Crp/Fnr family transcriptional regulator [Hymenobacter arizonensis]SFQ28535.1 cAMP-binding domain of CRP or a regulatory subunit of cAMP-dependent protein kinases [Hymenobacter arizonensis]
MHTVPAFAAEARAMLTASLSTVSYLPAPEIADFVSCWTKELHVPRNEFLVSPGQAEQYLYFTHHGTMRIFYPTASEEICVGFVHPGEMVCAFPLFAMGKPSEYAIQALQASSLIAIARHEFQSCLDSSPAFARLWRFEVERVLIGRMEHEIDLLLPEPAQRLERLRQRSPHIFQKVPKKYLASYLRMTPETLSRLR